MKNVGIVVSNSVDISQATLEKISQSFFRLKGYHKDFNETQDYDIAKSPAFRGWQTETITMSDGYRWLENGGWLGWRIPDNCVVVDIDHSQVAELVSKALVQYNLIYVEIKTPRGSQFIFQMTPGVKQGQHILCNAGIEIDYRVGGKGYIVLPTTNTKSRSIVRWPSNIQSLSPMPVAFDPIVNINGKASVSISDWLGLTDEQKKEAIFVVKRELSDGECHEFTYRHANRLKASHVEKSTALESLIFIRLAFFTEKKQAEYDKNWVESQWLSAEKYIGEQIHSKQKGNAKANKPSYQELSTDWADKHYEAILLNDGQIRFVEYDFNTGQWDIVNGLETPDKIILPPESLASLGLIIPSGVEEYGSEADLDREILDYLKRWVDLDEKNYYLTLSYIKLTWVSDRLRVLPYLTVRNPRIHGAGKTRFLKVVALICYRAIFDVTGSVAWYNRINTRYGPLTLVEDEAIFENSDDSRDFVRILNAGNDIQTARVGRVDKRTLEPEIFNRFGPKIFATRKPFESRALESRCAVIEINETKRRAADLPSEFTGDEEARQLGRKLLLWRLRHMRDNFESQFRQIELQLDQVGLRKREIQLGRVLLGFLDGKAKDAFITVLKERSKSDLENVQISQDALITRAIIDLTPYLPSLTVGQPIAGLTTSELLKRVNELIKEGDQKPINDAKLLGKRLRQLGLTTKQTTLNKKTGRYIILDPERIIALANDHYITIHEHSWYLWYLKSNSNAMKELEETMNINSEGTNGFNQNVINQDLNMEVPLIPLDLTEREFIAGNKSQELERSPSEVITQFLLPFDNLERALETAKLQDTQNGLLQGLELIKKQFTSVLAKYGVSVMETVGKPFDPFLHEATCAEYTDQYEEGIVIKEDQQGYKIGNRVLRPARVIVATRSKGGEDGTYQTEQVQE